MKITLKPGEHTRIAAGHPWVYDNEIAGEKGTAQDGVADVYSSGGHFIGRGFYNPSSRIRVRVVTRREEALDAAFFERAIQLADERRIRQGYVGSYRAVYAESDDLPGLIVDKFGDYLCVQMLSLGMAQREGLLVDLLCQRFSPKGILARNDVPVRQKEGLAQEVRLLYGDVPRRVEIEEGGMRMLAQPYDGQKTGYFLDQRDNHAAAARHARGRVLDAFSYMGGFAVACAMAGADEVTAVDISPQAVAAIGENAALNGVGRVRVQQANCFDLLSAMDKTGISFDTVILDPPAFCKNRAAQQNAMRGYKEINLRALKLLAPGGVLVTCSCSHYMYPELFWRMLRQAAADSGRQVRVIETPMQPADHPVRLAFDESHYLKCIVAQVD